MHLQHGEYGIFRAALCGFILNYRMLLAEQCISIIDFD